MWPCLTGRGPFCHVPTRGFVPARVTLPGKRQVAGLRASSPAWPTTPMMLGAARAGSETARAQWRGGVHRLAELRRAGQEAGAAAVSPGARGAVPPPALCPAPWRRAGPYSRGCLSPHSALLPSPSAGHCPRPARGGWAGLGAPTQVRPLGCCLVAGCGVGDLAEQGRRLPAAGEPLGCRERLWQAAAPVKARARLP